MILEPGRDVVKEIDDEFGFRPPRRQGTPKDKSL